MVQIQLLGGVVLAFVVACVVLLFLTRRTIIHWRGVAEKALEDADEEILAATRRFTHGFETSLIASFVMDDDMKVLRVNSAFVELSGFSEEQLIGQTIYQLVGKELGDAAARRLEVALEDERQFNQAIIEMVRADGSPLIYRETANVMPSTPSMDRHFIIQIEDVTEQHLSRVDLQRRALHDSLTGLPNRSLLLERLGTRLSELKSGQRLALAFLDIDDFKSINDQMGHAAGDELMVVVAKRLQGAVRHEDTVSRFGGDEFVILFGDVDSPVGALGSAERVRRSVSRPVLLEGREIDLTVSLGLAVGNSQVDSKALLREADSALYRSKEAGKNRSLLYDSRVEPEQVSSPTFESLMQLALQNGELRIDFEPVFALSGMTQVGLVASARWEHQELGSLDDSQIAALTAQEGMRELFEIWKLRAAMASFHQTVTSKRRNWWLTFQVCVETLCTGEFVASLADSLALWEIAPSRLLLEISDAVFTHRERAYNELTGPVRELGVRIMIRETGRDICFARSATARYDALTLDPDIVNTVVAESRGDAILQAFTQSATALGAPIFLGNLNTPELLDLARSSGADFVSGRALTATALDATWPAVVSGTHSQDRGISKGSLLSSASRESKSRITWSTD